MTERSWNLAMGLALATLTLLVFWSVGSHEFINYDTPLYIIANPHVYTGLTLDNVHWAFTAGHQANWHPLTWLSHMLDVELFGLQPGPHHLVNLVIHLLNAELLLYFLLRSTGQRWPSMMVACLFAIHPTQVESVAWVAERKDVLFTLFFMAGLHAYRGYIASPSAGRYLLVATLYLLGLMSKPMIVTFPFVLLLLDIWPFARLRTTPQLLAGDLYQLAREKMPLLLLSGLSIVVTFAVQQAGGAMTAGEELSVWQRTANALVAYAIYLKSALLPANLAAFYPHPGEWPTHWILASASAVFGMAVAGVATLRRAPFVFVGVGWFLGMLVPTIGLVQVGAQAFADRYTYVPHIGLFIILSFGTPMLAGRLGLRPEILRFGAAGLLAFYSAVTVQYLSYWQNGVSLWRHTLAVTDSEYEAILGIGDREPDRSSRLNGLSIPYFLAGSALVGQLHYEAALIHLDESTRLIGDAPHPQYLRGLALLGIGEIPAALEAFSRVETLAPDDRWLMDEIAKIRNRLPQQRD